MKKFPTRELRAALSVAAVYGYFLIFAQFSFVELLRAGGIGSVEEKIALGIMAATGIAGGFLAAWRGVSPNMARLALSIGGLAAVLATTSIGAVGFFVVALFTGAALGVATICLAALLPAWCGLAWVGLGTGLGYALCNVPVVFLQTPIAQAWIGVAFALTGVIVLPKQEEQLTMKTDAPLPFWGVVVIFTALVWLDSAAFFIIQHAEDLKSGTWGENLLWRNAVMHLVLACLAGVWMARGSAKSIPVIAWILLSAAAWFVNDSSTRLIAGFLYPAGVSLYSAALVAWPGWFSGSQNPRSTAWRAAWLFAIAGWFGSANGIGMAQSLERVPPIFVVAAGVVFVSVMFLANFNHWRIWACGSFVVLAAWLFSGGNSAQSPNATAAERGRRVYLAEGCIHCHSQYVRPGSPDEKIWGISRSLVNVLEDKPVTIGNRRHGPDLSNIGARRSPAWLKAHFIEPRTLVPHSPMPSYAHLFADRRGDDLVSYLKECGVEQASEMREKINAWKPAITTRSSDGKALFSSYCSACHGEQGHGDGALSKYFTKAPANLASGPFLWTPAGDDLESRTARVIKFGVAGTDMPGHEVMTDDQVNALVAEVLRLRNH